MSTSESNDRIVPTQGGAPIVPATPVDDWGAMGQAFEGMCKAGLALTVGFSVAAAFCRMMEAKNTSVSSVVGRMATAMFAQDKGGEKK